MSVASLGIHDVTKITIEEVSGAEGAVWRHVVFTCENGDKFTVTAFPTHRKKGEDDLPVTFVRPSREEEKA